MNKKEEEREELEALTDQIRDEADIAQALDLLNQRMVLERARQLNKPESHPDFDGKHCIECDIAIPKARLALFKIRCVDCQDFLERKQALNKKS